MSREQAQKNQSPENGDQSFLGRMEDGHDLTGGSSTPRPVDALDEPDSTDSNSRKETGGVRPSVSSVLDPNQLDQAPAGLGLDPSIGDGQEASEESRCVQFKRNFRGNAYSAGLKWGMVSGFIALVIAILWNEADPDFQSRLSKLGIKEIEGQIGLIVGVVAFIAFFVGTYRKARYKGWGWEPTMNLLEGGSESPGHPRLKKARNSDPVDPPTSTGGGKHAYDSDSDSDKSIYTPRN